MLQNSAQVTLCPGVYLGVQHIISSLSILNFGISITNMEVAMLVYFAAPEGPLQVGLFICKQSAVFSENLSIRTVKTRYQSVSMLHWSPRVLWMLVCQCLFFLICKILLIVLLKVGWFLRHISSYECHVVRICPPKRAIYRKEMWTEVPGPQVLVAVWCSGMTMFMKRLVSGSDFLRIHMIWGNS